MSKPKDFSELSLSDAIGIKNMAENKQKKLQKEFVNLTKLSDLIQNECDIKETIFVIHECEKRITKLTT